MNKTYRLIWNSVKDCLVVVAETVKSRCSFPSLLVGSAALMAAIPCGAMPASALDPGALPTNGQIVAGSGKIAQSGSNMTVNQASDRMVANWGTFNIGQNAAVTFRQPGASSIALNRILGQSPSQIMGSLSANGQVFLLNPSGIIFGQTAQVDVGGLVATSLNLTNENFMAGKNIFVSPLSPGEQGNGDGSILNRGNIRTTSGGYVAFLGPQVKNEGIITTTGGSVVMAAGDKVTLDFVGDGLLTYSIEQGAVDALVENNGLIKADGGMVVMTARAANSLTQAVVNNSGVVEANRLVEKNGKIVLEGGQIIQSGTLTASGGIQGGYIAISGSGMVMNTGIIEATGEAGGQVTVTAHAVVEQGTVDAGGTQKGGQVLLAAAGSLEQSALSTVRADATQGKAGTVRIESQGGAYLSGTLSASGLNGGEIAVTAKDLIVSGAAIHADGVQGGGLVRIGGGWQGKDTDLANAEKTTVNHAYVTANATGSGNGGMVVVWSEELTQMAGAIEAKGGNGGGNGGQVEISSHGTLGLGGTVDVKAPAGTNGSLLLDPKDINIVDSVASYSSISLTYATPQADDQNGSLGAYELTNGADGTDRVVVVSQYDNTSASAAGAVRLYRMSDGQLLATLTGSQANDNIGSNGVTPLANGNYVVQSSLWDNGAIADAGAVTWGSGTTGIAGVVSAANSLVGSTASDKVGSKSVTVTPNAGVTALDNGNYLVQSSLWDNGAIADAGAVTWGNGTTGIAGAVSVANSLVGSTLNDQIGGTGITVLANGNYVVQSSLWNNGAIADAGAATWGNGTTGITGTVSIANSLVGSTLSDKVGTGITALTNGNYVVRSSLWNSGAIADAGAATWGNGTTGITGTVSAANSLVGSTASDQVGSGITALANGNYVVRSNLWNNGAIADAGAATWGNGTTGISGTISVANSLVGSTASDQVGSAGVTALANGNYVVQSSLWNNGAIADAGAATWGNGTTGISGTISVANSLVGSTASDQVGSAGVTALTNDNYLVRSTNWDNGAIVNAGAVTWGNGTTGIVGEVSAVNSLVGGTANDQVGLGVVTTLTNGNYVVQSSNWDNGTIVNAGAVTWGDGTTGIVGEVSAANSLVGSTASDQVGSAGVRALLNGNYVVQSSNWTNGGAAKAGAVTWGNGTTGIVGEVSAVNSLVGTTADDQVGAKIIILTNDNYVVRSINWDNAGAGAIDAGAMTWGDGTTGVVGEVSAANSLVGSTANDKLGYDGITSLTNGNYLVRSSFWDNGAVSDAGAVTLGDGSKGIIGTVSAANSLMGTAASDRMGSENPVAMADGSVLVSCSTCDAGGLVNSGQVDIIKANSATPLTNPHTFATNPTGTSTLLASSIKALLDAGTAVTLQANNDITLGTALTVNNATGDGGALTLLAGRSILLNADITTDNGNLTLAANETTAAGVVDANRDVGNAVITMAGGTSIDAGTGAVTINLKNGAGKTNFDTGDITLRNITAGNLSVTANGSAATHIIGSGILTISGMSTLEARSDSNIILDNAANNFTGAVSVISGNDVNLVDSDALVLGTSMVSGNLTVQTGGGLTQNGALAVAGTTNLTAGANDISLADAGNDFTGAVSVLTGKNIALADSDAMSLAAITSTGTVDIATLTGNLTINGNIATTDTSADAIKMNAGKSASAGTSTGGDIIINGSPTISTGAGGIATLYSGSLAGSNGLVNLIGSGSGRFRYNSDEAASHFTAPLVAGINGVYREQPTLTVTPDSHTITYGDPTPAFASTTGTSYVNGDISAGTVTGTATWNVSGTKSTSDNYTAGSHDVSYVNGVVSSFGYGFVNNAASSNELTVNQRTVTTSGITASNKVFDSTTTATINSGDALFTGLVAGDALTVSATGVFSDKNAGNNKTVTLTSSYGGADQGNYIITGLAATTADITPKTMTITAATNSKVYDATTIATATPTVSGLLGSDTVTGLSETYADKNAGINKTINVSAYTVNDGNSGNNYTVITVTDTTGVITKAPLSVIANDDNKTYDGVAYKGGNGVAFNGFVNSETSAVLGGKLGYSGTSQGATSKGSYIISPSGLTSSNYLLGFVDGSLVISGNPSPSNNSILCNVVASISSFQLHVNGTQEQVDANGFQSVTSNNRSSYINIGPGAGIGIFEGNGLGGLITEQTGYLADDERRNR